MTASAAFRRCGARAASSRTSSATEVSVDVNTRSRAATRGRAAATRSLSALRRPRRDRVSFNRVEVDLQQYISLLHEPPRPGAARRLRRCRTRTSGARGAVLLPADARRPRRPARLPPVPLPRPQRCCCSRPSTAGRSSRPWTARSSTTPARSRSRVEDLEPARPRVATTASASGSARSNGVFLRVEGAFGSSGGKHFIFRFGHVF